MSLRILVLESDPSNGWFQEQRLKAEGYSVTVCNTAIEGMQLIDEESFDFVLSGALRWVECYEAAIKKYGKEKVIIYTASGILAKRLRDEGLGLKVYVKSFNNSGINRTLSGVVAEIKRALQEHT